jgi:integrase
MASGPYFDKKTGAWTVQFWDGEWHRVVVMRKPKGWEPDKGRPKKIPSFATEELERYAAIEENARRVHSSGIPHRLDQFLSNHVKRYKNEKTRESVQKTVKQFLEWCESKEVHTFKNVTTDLCVEWIEHSLRDLKVTTVKTRRAQLKGAWTKLCKRKGLVDPWADAEVEGKPEIKKRGAWTVDEFDALLAVSRPWLKEVLIVGVYTGLRINALMNLRWEHVDTASGNDQGDFGFINVPAHLDKAKKGYQVPIARRLADLLMEIRTTTNRDFVLSGQHRKPLVWSSSTGQAIIRACKRAGLKKPDSPNHHMRRTFGRWAHFGHLVGKSIPIYAVMEMLGHASTTMTMKYLGITEKELSIYMRESPQAGA